MEKVLVFCTGAKGGVGKSTLAILMIEALKEAGLDVAAIEGDEKSPSLSRKYANGRVHLGHIDLASVIDQAGQVDFGEVLNELPEQWVIVNTPAAGARMFDNTPEVLNTLDYSKRAAWCLSLNAEGNSDGIEDDGLFASLDRGLLSAMDPEDVTAVRSLFQVANRKRGFWFDNANQLADILGLKTLDVANLHSSIVEAIHRDVASMPELIARFNNIDPIAGAGLEIFWNTIKTSLAKSVLAGADLKIKNGFQNNRGRLFGPKGLTQRVLQNSTSEQNPTEVTPAGEPVLETTKRSNVTKEALGG